MLQISSILRVGRPRGAARGRFAERARDDFHSSGRISGNQQIPLAKLASGKKYIVEGQRLEVNPSVDSCKREMANLSAALKMKEAAN